MHPRITSYNVCYTKLLRDQQGRMEIAVADMAEDRRDEAGCGDVFLRAGDAFGQFGDRHADVGGQRAAAGAELQAGEIGVVAGLPELASVFRPGRPFETGAGMFGGQGFDGLRLFFDAGRITSYNVCYTKLLR